MSKFPFGVEKAQESPGFLLWQTTMVWQRQIKKALEAHDISHAQFVILATLMWFEMHHYETAQIGIVNWTQLDKMTVSKSLKKLVSLGYIYRVEHRTDTRAKSVSLTNLGQDKIRVLIPLVETIDQQFFGQSSKEDQKNLIAILAKLIKS